jgi:predicted transcriptional regulator
MIHQDRMTGSEHIDRSCELLRSERRRRVIYTLRRSGPTSLSELADVVTTAGLADDRQRAVASLVHTHLPKLSDADVVEYDGTGEPVSLADGVECLEPFLAVAAEREAERERPSFSGPAAASDAVAQNTPD